MKKNDVQLGKPETIYLDDKSAIESLSAVEGMIAYATDTHEFGSFNGTTWDWGTGSADVDASDVTYSPAVPSYWDGVLDPGNVDDALDQLAERVYAIDGVNILVQDDFNRADATTVGAPQIGSIPITWPNVGAGIWGITSNEVAAKSSVGESVVLWETNTFRYVISGNYRAFGDGGVVCRSPGGDQWILLYPNVGAGRYELYVRSGGYGLLAYGGSTPQVGDAFKVYVTPSHIVAKINNIEVINYYTMIYNASLFAGFRSNNNTTDRFDNLLIESYYAP